MLDAIARAQERSLVETHRQVASDGLLADLLALTESEYGFIGEVCGGPTGAQYVRVHAISDITWSDETRTRYQANLRSGIELRDLKTLIGQVLRTGLPVMRRQPTTDPLSGGLPPGYPALNTFLGIPIAIRGELVAMAAVANRPGGYDLDMVEWLKPMLNAIAQLVMSKRLERGTHEARDLLRHVLAADSEVVIIATNPEGIISLFNRGAERLLGYSADEVVGRFTPQIFHLAEEVEARADAAGLEAEARLGIFVNVPLELGSERQEWTYVHRDGRHIPVSLVVTCIRGADGDVLGFVGVAEDISRRKAAEAVLVESARHTQAILDNVLDGIVTINRIGMIQVFNKSAERIFGYSAAEVVGSNVSRLMPSSEAAHHDSYLARYLSTGEARVVGRAREMRGVRKDGRVFPLELAVSEVRLPEGVIFIGMVRDLSERDRMERLKKEFVATVSHELRTPLTSITGALGLLDAGALGPLPGGAARMVDLAQKNCRRLTRLIDDLLDMEKVAAGKLKLDQRDHDLMPLLEQALEANRPYAGALGVTLALTARAEVKVRVDAHRLLQVMANLLSNAAKFSPRQSTVRVGATQTSEGVRVAVTDSGPGVAPDFQERLFEQFSQADGSDARPIGGSGLGLAISRELVERMGGRIGYEPAPTGGATFFVVLVLAVGE